MCENTPSVITSRKPLGPTDYLMTISRIFFPIYLAVGIPLNGYPLRLLISQMAGMKQPTSKTYQVTISITILAIAGFVAYIFPNITNLISIMGGICCVSIVITFPGRLFNSNVTFRNGFCTHNWRERCKLESLGRYKLNNVVDIHGVSCSSTFNFKCIWDSRS